MRRFAAIAIVAALLYLPTIRSRNLQDCGASSRLATAESLVERATFVIDQSTFAYTCDRMALDGRFYSDKPPLLSVISAAVYALLHHGFGRRFDHEAHPITNPVNDTTYGLMIALVVVLAQAFLVASFDRAAGKMHVGGAARWLAVATVGFGTILWPLTALFNSHTVAAVAIFVGLVATLVDGRPLLGGLLLGVAAAVDIPLGLLALALAIVLGSGRRWVVAGCLAPLAVHAALNWWIVGDVIPFQLHRELYTSATGHTGESATGFAQDAGLGVYAMRNLVGSLGVFSLTPVLLLALPLAVREALSGTQRRLALAAVGLFVASLFLYVVVWPSAVGCAYGMRHVAPAVAPLLLVAAVVVSRSRRLLVAFIVLAILSMILAGGGLLGPATCSGFVEDARASVPALVFIDNVRQTLGR